MTIRDWQATFSKPASMRSDTVEFRKRSIERGIALLLLLWVLGIWILFLIQLFQPGYLLNYEHPLHQGLLVCAHRSPIWSLPAVWCDHLMAGVAPFQIYPIPFYMLVLSLMKVFSLAVAYKAGLVMAWLSIPLAVGAAISLTGRPLAGAIAASFLLLEHGARDSSGIEFLVLAGSAFNQALGFAFLVTTLICLEWYFRCPNHRRFTLLCVTTAIYFLVHPTTFLFFPIPLTIMMWHHRKEAWRQRYYLMAYPLIVVFLAGFWLLPFLSNGVLQFFNLHPGGGPQFMESMNTFLIKPMNPVLLLVGVMGIVRLTKKGEWPLTLVPVFSVLVILINVLYSFFPSFGGFQLMQANRLLALLRICILIGASILLSDGILGVKKRGVLIRMASLLAIIYLIASMGGSLKEKRADIAVLPIEFDPSGSGPYNSDMKGRILIEETYGQSVGFSNMTSFWGLSPVILNIPAINQVISYPNIPYAGTAGGFLLGTPITKYSRERLLNTLELLNVQYVLAGSPNYLTTLSFLQPVKTLFSWQLFRNNATPLGWFRIVNGRVIQEKYTSEEAWAIIENKEASRLLFKTRYWPNWKASIDEKETVVYKNSLEFMEVDVPSGQHIVKFKYELKWLDYLGWMLSLLGAGLLIFIHLLGMHRMARPTAGSQKEIGKELQYGS